MKNLFLVLAGLCIVSVTKAQIGIGQWETFQSYSNGKSLAIQGSKVYCGTEQGLYSYDYNTNEMEEYTKPMGYVGLGVTAIGYSPKVNASIVAYSDANLDIIKDNEIINLPQIKNYSLTGDKNIYNITITGDSAILSCGFGVVVVDLRKEIIKTDVKFSDDIGFAGEVCYDAAIMGGYYYFATSQGMYKVLYTSNIKDLSNWQLMSGLPTGKFNNVVNHNNTLYFNYSAFLTVSADNADTIYSSNGTTHSVFQSGWAVTVADITSNNGLMGILDPEESRIFNASGTLSNSIAPGCYARGEKIDIDASGKPWIALVGYGLLYYESGTCFIQAKDGPFSKNVWDMQFMNGDIWVAAGGVNIGDGNVYVADKMYYRRDGDWKWCNIPNYGNGDAVDIHCLAIEPNNAGHVYGGSWGTGLYEVSNYLPNTQYLTPEVDSTSALLPLGYRVGGMAFDSKNTLWYTNSNQDSGQLRFRTSAGTFGEAPVLLTVNGTNNVGKVAVDERDQIWVAVNGKGIVVVKNDGTGQQRVLGSSFNQGDLPQLSVRAMECDKDGQMWVGTHDGIRIFSPSQVFPTSNAINGQKIVIKDDNGINELLLKETIINDIEADGANRKWIATMGTGVRLVSEDGRDIIYSFTAENSPLLSNNVHCVAINDEDGTVCFGTDKGICCFRAEATGSTDTFGDVYAYPNPVKPTYDGPIAITGMATNSIVKITDIAGNIVYETTSEGGQAIWNGKKYDGKRPSTGVYLVFCVNEDASQTVVTKILFIN